MESIVCTTCNHSKSPNEFSLRQSTKKWPKCNSCLQPKHQQIKEEHVKSLFRHNYTCGSCYETFSSKDAFSKSQLMKYSPHCKGCAKKEHENLLKRHHVEKIKKEYWLSD